MTSIKESAKNYVPKTTKNIAELQKVRCDAEIHHKVSSRKDGDKTEFEYDYIIVDNTEYRVPATVLKSLKVMVEQIPDLEFFKVIKTGTTKNDTVYTVVPLVDATDETEN